MIPQEKIEQKIKELGYGNIRPKAFTAGVRFAEAELQPIIRDDTPWSLVAILQTLIYSSDYLLHKKDYDGIYHEEIELAIKNGSEIIKFMQERKNQ